MRFIRARETGRRGGWTKIRGGFEGERGRFVAL